MDDLIDFKDYKIIINYNSKLKKLILNENLPKQIASPINNFKRYKIKINEGFLKLDGINFDTNGNYIDWIITNENELLFGHGHAFLSKHEKNIKNAGGIMIKEGKAIGLSNGSGHYLPKLEYLDEVLMIFKELDILSDDYRILRYKYKI